MEKKQLIDRLIIFATDIVIWTVAFILMFLVLDSYSVIKIEHDNQEIQNDR